MKINSTALKSLSIVSTTVELEVPTGHADKAYPVITPQLEPPPHSDSVHTST